MCAQMSLLWERACVCGYLGGVGVAISSTNRRRVNHRAWFALWARTLVQTGIFETREEIQKPYVTPTHWTSDCMHVKNVSNDALLDVVSIIPKQMFFKHFVSVMCFLVLTSISEMRQGLGFMCDYFLICWHCVVVIVLLLRMGNEVSMALLSSVQSAVSQTDTHTHTKPIHITWQDFVSVVRQCQCWGNWTKQ